MTSDDIQPKPYLSSLIDSPPFSAGVEAWRAHLKELQEYERETGEAGVKGLIESAELMIAEMEKRGL